MSSRKPRTAGCRCRVASTRAEEARLDTSVHGHAYWAWECLHFAVRARQERAGSANNRNFRAQFRDDSRPAAARHGPNVAVNPRKAERAQEIKLAECLKVLEEFEAENRKMQPCAATHSNAGAIRAAIYEERAPSPTLAMQRIRLSPCNSTRRIHCG